MLSNEHVEKLDQAIEVLLEVERPDPGLTKIQRDFKYGNAMTLLGELRKDLEEAIADEKRRVTISESVELSTLNEPGTTLNYGRSEYRKKRKNTGLLRRRTEEEFDRFWAAVKLKVNKRDAMRAFDGIGDVDIDFLIQKLEECQSWHLNRHGHLDYMPRPNTWLFKRRWEDDLTWGA